ncbi:putative transcriptional regulatory protein [Escovopsis weberi]|uniref:Putative transcriptional regulatory protein n=1 Tax=Escovopsis weberi TaxID=150374 RepID=A0A0M8MXA5_ESCWE|nr:putative transcriptional regulatory protein [Escovopsis weberi]
MSRGGDDEGFRNGLACQNCRQRKRRCDRQLPRCGLCARRGVECVISTAKNEGQEGMIESLERELARLEARLPQTRAPDELRGIPESTSKAHDREGPDAIPSSLVRQPSPETVDLNVLKEVETVSLYRGELYGLEEMTHRALRLDNSDPRGFFNNSEARKSLISSSSRSHDSAQGAAEPPLDRETTRRYADNFFSHVHPTFPILEELEARGAIQLMLEGRRIGPEERIMAYLVLAIGAILPSQSSVLDTVNSAKYFLSAAEVQCSYDESPKTARILILFTLYSLFDSTTGSSWHLIDLVMQVCIVLGLHQLQVRAGERGEEEGARIFQAAYMLDFMISTALGLPMSTRNSDITMKPEALVPAGSPAHAPHIPDALTILTPECLYRWAHELCEGPHHNAAHFLRAYGAHILHDTGTSDDQVRRSVPSILGWHLAVQSLRRMAPGEASRASRNGQLVDHWQAIPKTMPALLMMPWIAGYTAFQTILLRMVMCGVVPDGKPQLLQSLSYSNLILSAVSSKFQGLKPHAEFGSIIHRGLMRDSSRLKADVGFLEGSDLYDLCRQALHRQGIPQYERGYVADLKARISRLRGLVNDSGLEPSSGSSSSSEGPPGQEALSKRPKFSDGSIFSLGHLVAAVLSMQLRNGSGFRIGPLTQPQVPDRDIIPPGDQELPPLSLACELADTYLEVGFHRVSPFVRRRQVFEQIERLYDPRSCQADRSSLERQNDMFQLFMILAVGAPFSKRRLQDMAPIRFYASAMRYADVLSETSGDVQIQNTLFLLTFAQQHATGIGSKWKLARQAMRTCLQLGYHKASTRPIDPVAEQMRRRLFWCCYVQERYAARGLGRPMVVAESDITIPFPDHVNLDDDRSGLVPDPLNRSDVSVLNRQAQLRRISAKVRDELYTRRGAGGRVGFLERVEVAQRLSAELEQWRALHAECSTTPYSKCIFETREYMDVNYFRERMFIYSALVVPADAELHAFRPDVKYLRLCLEAAVQIVVLYQLMLQRGIQTTLWTWVQDALRSGFMILYCGIHISNIFSDYHKVNSPTAPNVPEPAMIIQALDDCRKMLKDISHKWAAVNPHWAAFDRLSGQVKKLIESLSRPDTAADQPAPAVESSSSSIEMGGAMQLDDQGLGASGLWDIPMDMAYWDDLMDGDVDMNEVFGFDFNVFAQSAVWNASNDG